MANQEERNYCCLALLLLRVGNPCLRRYFKNQWNAAGKYIAWTDCAQNGTDLLRMFRPLPYERNKVKSGDTSQWDMSLLVKALLYSNLPFVVEADLVTALKTLKEMRDNLCHSPNIKVEATDFQKKWTDGCNALKLFGATAGDFDKVEQDVQKPWSELLPMMKHCADQDQAILDTLDSFNSKLEQLQQGQDNITEGQAKLLQGQDNVAEGQAKLLQGQDNVAEGQAKLLQGQDNIEEGQAKLQQGQDNIEEGQAKLLQGQDNVAEGQAKLLKGQDTMIEFLESYTKVDQVLSQGQQGQKRSSADVQPEEDVKTKKPRTTIDNRERDHAEVDLVLSQGQQGQKRSAADVQPEEDVKTKKPRTTINNRERDHAEDSEMLKEAIKANTEYQTKIMAVHDVPSAKTDEIFTNLTVYYADKKQEKKEQAKDLGRSEQLQEYTKRTMSCKVEKYEDVFIDMNGENPKLLLTGKPGIGKTFLCKKVMRDWSLNRLFHNENTPNIEFAYLLKFRQLSLQGDKEMNLQELLNRSPLLDNNSVIDDSLFEHLIQDPSKVLIILDGFDECSEQHRKQIASDYEEQYSNNPKEKMPIPALCSKLIRGKVLRKAVVLVSSRPGKTKELGKINFDRYVEISGFSPEQVTEYVDKYFSEKEQTKKAVREHVEKNENLISFCHIPLSSFLLCWCLEWRINRSGITENLPAKITDLYDEVSKVLIEKLHANLKYSEMSEYAKKIAEDTLDKLAKLGANLLKESRYIFDEEDMKKLDLTDDEIKNLKESGILHCVPGIRISAFRTKEEFSFTHLTLQEYLSASFFVKNNEIPKKVSGRTFVFMCGLLSKEKDGEKLMNDLIQQISPKDKRFKLNKLLMLQCLYEYGEEELTTITINNLYDKYCDSEGVIRFENVTDADMKYVSYLLDIIRSLKEEHPQPSSDYTLYIRRSPALTSFGFGVVCRSLVRNSFITKLQLPDYSLDDKCVEKPTDSLVNTGITHLDLHDNKITDEGVKSICTVLTQSKITHLNLKGSNIRDKGVKSICSVLKQTKISDLDLLKNNITDEGVNSICSVLTQTKITYLNLGWNDITDEGVKSICSVLTQTKITYLDLRVNNITDEGVKSICSVLTQTKITHLNLSNNKITEEGVKSICSVITQTKITHLYLTRNNITNKGVKSICSVLAQTKITLLDLKGNNITDEGAESICSVLTQTKICYLDLKENNITDEGAKSICRVLMQDDCQVKYLDLSGNNRITAECKERVKQLVKEHKLGVYLFI